MSIIEKRQRKIMLNLGFKMRRGNRFNPNPEKNGTWWDHPYGATLFLSNTDNSVTEKWVVCAAINSAMCRYRRNVRFSVTEAIDSCPLIEKQ